MGIAGAERLRPKETRHLLPWRPFILPPQHRGESDLSYSVRCSKLRDEHNSRHEPEHVTRKREEEEKRQRAQERYGGDYADRMHDYYTGSRTQPVRAKPSSQPLPPTRMVPPAPKARPKKYHRETLSSSDLESKIAGNMRNDIELMKKEIISLKGEIINLNRDLAEVEAKQGWICPKCKTVHNPNTKGCSCDTVTIVAFKR